MKIFLLLILASISSTLNAKPYCISHRGVTENSIENSMSSIQNAINVGSDGVEFDIHHTKDGHAILMHDEDLVRVAKSRDGRKCPVTSLVKDLRLREIQNNCVLKNGEEIATLEEALQYLETRDLYTFLELKDSPNTRSIQLIEEYNRQKPELLRVISFESKALRVLKKLRQISDFWRDVELMRVYKFLPFSFSDYGVDIYYKTRFMAWLPRLFGKELGVWTVDEDKDLRRVIKRKIKFITTNRVERCMELKEN
ncbi:glycerophosphodiester phosphodiesterase [Halobacteriovorax marinus]|uniref:glycerophosphodiester phosphodiesterase n=1 Tax=Halobacteriovorax marinus TaxID=97084 RepID=UPI003A928E35